MLILRGKEEDEEEYRGRKDSNSLTGPNVAIIST